MKRNKVMASLLVGGTLMGVSACNTTKEQTKQNTSKVVPPVTFVFNKKGECYAKNKQNISAEEFERLTKSAGWEWQSSCMIDKNGNVTTADFYQSIVGMSPINYYFSDGQCHSFFFSNATGQNVKYDYDYRFDPKTGILDIKGHARLNIVRMTEDEVGILERISCDADGKPEYAYTVYNRLDEQTLMGVLMQRRLTVKKLILK